MTCQIGLITENAHLNAPSQDTHSTPYSLSTTKYFSFPPDLCQELYFCMLFFDYVGINSQPGLF